MALINILKKSKSEKKRPEQKSEKKAKEAAVGRAPKTKALNKLSARPSTNEISAPEKKDKKDAEFSAAAWQVLRHPHITEKAADLAEKNQYVFQVRSSANKPTVKKAIEDLYGVNVLSVHIINVPPKKRVRGRIEGWRSGYKKAIVRLKKGQQIEILPR